jgi:hypothetical protein
MRFTLVPVMGCHESAREFHKQSPTIGRPQIDTLEYLALGRIVRFTGAGSEILVDLYLNRAFFQRVTTTTR